MKESQSFSLVGFGNSSLLLVVQGKKLGLLLGAQALISVNAAFNLISKDWHEWISLVGHRSVSDALESRSESGILDRSRLLCVGEGTLQLIESTRANTVQETLEVVVLKALDGGEHVLGTAVEVVLKLVSGLGEVVNKGSLLNVLVLLGDVVVLHLLLGVLQVFHLNLLDDIGPLGAHLLELVVGVDIVEDGHLWTWNPVEVTGLSNTEVEGNDELVMVEHASDPLVVGPTTKLGEGSNRSDVGEKEDNTATGAGERLVVWRDLFWTDGLKQEFVVLVSVEDHWGGIIVVWVHITMLHLGDFIMVVCSSVLLVVGLRTTHIK